MLKSLSIFLRGLGGPESLATTSTSTLKANATPKKSLSQGKGNNEASNIFIMGPMSKSSSLERYEPPKVRFGGYFRLKMAKFLSKRISTTAKSRKQDGTTQKCVPRRKVCFFVNFYFQCTLQNGYLAAHSAPTKDFWTIRSNRYNYKSYSLHYFPYETNILFWVALDFKEIGRDKIYLHIPWGDQRKFHNDGIYRPQRTVQE